MYNAVNQKLYETALFISNQEYNAQFTQRLAKLITNGLHSINYISILQCVNVMSRPSLDEINQEVYNTS